jgi:predicted DNA-binding transcriptional regulator YafY
MARQSADLSGSPTARALLALQELQERPGVRAAELGIALGVSERAARRYIEVLRAAQIPIESTRGRYGGYRIGRGLRLPPLVFTSAEALGVVMAVLDGHHAASDPRDLVGGALGKIIRALPAPVAAQAEAVRRTTATAPDLAAARPNPEITTALVHAISRRHQVLIDYCSEFANSWQDQLDPWSVVVRHGRWYLLNFSHRAGEPRAFRVDRISRVRELAETFDPPTGLDPVAFLEEHLAIGWDYPAEVLVYAPIEKIRGRLPSSLGRLERVDDETTRLIGTTGNPYWYAERLAALPASFTVIGGPEIKATVQRLGERLLAAVEAATADA